jgi:hypothetical protein
MKKLSLIIGGILISSKLFAGIHGPCKIENFKQSNSYPKYMIVTMECEGSSLPTTCTNLNKKAVVFDSTTDIGKTRTSILLTAFASNKNVRISTYGACPSDITSVPPIYGITLYK